MDTKALVKAFIVCFVASTVFLWTNIAHADKAVPLFEGRLSFSLPPGFSLMTPEIARIKYPNGKLPEYAFANEQTEQGRGCKMVR